MPFDFCAQPFITTRYPKRFFFLSVYHRFSYPPQHNVTGSDPGRTSDPPQRIELNPVEATRETINVRLQTECIHIAQTDSVIADIVFNKNGESDAPAYKAQP